MPTADKGRLQTGGFGTRNRTVGFAASRPGGDAGATDKGRKRRLGFHAERMMSIAADEIINVAQAGWVGLHDSPSFMIDEAKSRHPERFDLGPLLRVRPSRDLEGSAHPAKLFATFGAFRS